MSTPTAASSMITLMTSVTEEVTWLGAPARRRMPWKNLVRRVPTTKIRPSEIANSATTKRKEPLPLVPVAVLVLIVVA